MLLVLQHVRGGFMPPCLFEFLGIWRGKPAGRSIRTAFQHCGQSGHYGHLFKIRSRPQHTKPGGKCSVNLAELARIALFRILHLYRRTNCPVGFFSLFRCGGTNCRGGRNGRSYDAIPLHTLFRATNCQLVSRFPLSRPHRPDSASGHRAIRCR